MYKVKSVTEYLLFQQSIAGLKATPEYREMLPTYVNNLPPRYNVFF